MWDMRRVLQPVGLADRPTVVEFRILGGSRPARSRYWLVVEESGIDLCLVDPQRDVDLCVEASLKALTEVCPGRIDLGKSCAPRPLHRPTSAGVTG